eukprot:c21973_g1_i5 orf=543-1715(-)
MAEDSLFCGLVCSSIRSTGKPCFPVESTPSGQTDRISEQPPFPYEWNWSTHTSLKSAVELFACSNETESEDDDDYIAGLAKQIAHSMLEDDEASEDKSDQSRAYTLKNTRSTVATEVLPPFLTKLSTSNCTSSSAADSNFFPVITSNIRTRQLSGQQRLPTGVEVSAYQRQTLSLGQNPPPTRPQASYTETRASRLTSLSNGKIPPALQFRKRSLSDKRRQEESVIKICQPRVPKHSSVSGRDVVQRQGGVPSESVQRTSCSVDALSSKRPSAQLVSGSGLTAMFLGTNVSGRESVGTGVFFPRIVGSASDNKKRPACCSVLLPSRIVHALKLNAEDVGSPLVGPATTLLQPSMERGNETGSLGKPLNSTCSSLQQQFASDISLPSEWTY